MNTKILIALCVLSINVLCWAGDDKFPLQQLTSYMEAKRNGAIVPRGEQIVFPRIRDGKLYVATEAKLQADLKQLEGAFAVYAMYWELTQQQKGGTVSMQSSDDDSDS